MQSAVSPRGAARPVGISLPPFRMDQDHKHDMPEADDAAADTKSDMKDAAKTADAAGHDAMNK